jgi:TonB family protein
MSANQSSNSGAGAKQSDLLLWVAAGVIASVGAAWLLISKPWSAGPQRAVSAVEAPAFEGGGEPVELALATPLPTPSAGDGQPAALDNPLRMAQLAFDAGMLVEPEEYSAWTLYSRVLESEPDNAAALEGLTQVADELVRRGSTALEQGRFDDVRRTTQRILALLPEHAGAKELAASMWPDAAVARAPEMEPLKPELPARQPPPTVAPVEPVREAPAAPARDLVAEAGAAFDAAMSASRLLAPAEQSAKHLLDELIALAPQHEITQIASRRLSDELLSRAEQSLEGLDTEAAKVWIDEAERIGADPRGVRAAREDLANQLVAMESAKPIPASALTIVDYVAPDYPSRALDRGIEGWVDIEFTIGTDGSTRDVTVADASHEAFFRREALEAVEAWRFEPRQFMGRTIDQRSYTRIRFVQ